MADLLVLDLHTRIVRNISKHEAIHFEGLGAAARHMWRKGVFDGRLKKKLLDLEAAYNITRHITAVSADRLAERVATMLPAEPATPNSATPDPAADTSCVEPLEDIAPSRKRLTTKTTLPESGKGYQPTIGKSLDKEATAKEEDGTRQRQKENSSPTVAGGDLRRLVATAEPWVVAVAATEVEEQPGKRLKFEAKEQSDKTVRGLAKDPNTKEELAKNFWHQLGPPG